MTLHVILQFLARSLQVLIVPAGWVLSATFQARYFRHIILLNTLDEGDYILLQMNAENHENQNVDFTSEHHCRVGLCICDILVVSSGNHIWCYMRIRVQHGRWWLQLPQPQSL